MTTYSAHLFEEKSIVPIPIEVSITQSGIKANTNKGFWSFSDLKQIVMEGETVRLEFASTNGIQMLEITDNGFIKELRTQSPKLLLDKNAQVYNLKRTILWLGLIFLGLISLVIITYFSVVPKMAKYIVDFIPKETEIAIGRHMHKSYLMSVQIDTQATAIANNFLAQLNLKSGYPLHITVVNSPVKNAFSVPGGGVVIYTGILHQMNSYTELAALIGHEAGHIYHKHSLKMLLNQGGAYFMLSVLFAGIDNLSYVFIENAAKIRQLSYSREAEFEADNYSFLTLQKNHLDPQGMVSLFLHLASDNNISEDAPTFMQTHPKLQSRISQTQNDIKNHGYKIANDAQLENYWKMLQTHFRHTGK